MSKAPYPYYVTRAGAAGDPASDPAMRLMMDNPPEPGGRALLVEGGCGALAARLAPLFTSVICQNSLFPSHAACLETMREPGFAHVECRLGDIPRCDEAGPDSSPVYPAAGFDAVFFRLSRGTAQVNAVLAEAFRLLRREGCLVVAGHNQEGIKSFAKRAESHFGNLELLGMKASCRLLRFRKEGEAPVLPPADADYFRPVSLSLPLPGRDAVPYLSKAGIFSYRATDAGTSLLASHLPDCAGLRTLDVGCGSGVLSLAAHRLGARELVAVDVNAIATAMAARNFREQGVPGTALCTYLTEGVEGEFDLVLANPPFHQGADTDFSLPGKILDAILPRLKPGGRLFLVSNQFLDYRAQGLQRFPAVETLARENGYAVYRMGKP